MPKKKKKLFGDIEHGPVTQEVLRKRREVSASTPNSYSVGTYSVKGTYDGAPAPRVGGSAPRSTSVASGTASKSAIRKAVKRVAKTSASKQAKKAARRAYR